MRYSDHFLSSTYNFPQRKEALLVQHHQQSLRVQSLLYYVTISSFSCKSCVIKWDNNQMRVLVATISLCSNFHPTQPRTKICRCMMRYRDYSPSSAYSFPHTEEELLVQISENLSIVVVRLPLSFSICCKSCGVKSFSKPPSQTLLYHITKISTTSKCAKCTNMLLNSCLTNLYVAFQFCFQKAVIACFPRGNI